MTTKKIGRCPICKSPAKVPGARYIDWNNINCFRCGEYKITYEAIEDFGGFDENEITNICGWIRENPEILIRTDKFKLFKNLKIPTVGGKATKLLKYIAIVKPIPGDFIEIGFETVSKLITNGDDQDFTKSNIYKMKTTLPFLGVAWAKDHIELKYLINDYLINEKKYLESQPIIINGPLSYKITPKGWSFLDSLNYKSQNNELIFIASKYNDDINRFLDNNVVPVLQQLNYIPKLMRSHPHTNIIDNEMISLIKRSKFVIVDLTENSLGAYYEAGYAHGFGLEVIFLCEKSFRENKKNKKGKGVHFDTNHYPINDWEYDKGEELQKTLRYLIDVKFGGRNKYY